MGLMFTLFILLIIKKDKYGCYRQVIGQHSGFGSSNLSEYKNGFLDYSK